MIREDMLALLIAQQVERGGDLVTLRAIVEEASELGSARALARGAQRARPARSVACRMVDLIMGSSR